jgi:VWFA-related protein
MIGRILLACVLTLVWQAPQPRFRSGVSVVEVDVSVTRGNVPVTGLIAENFTVSDNGVAQQITSVTLDRLPLNVLLVLDTSTSLAGEKLAHLTDAARQLVRSLRPGDRVALVTFSQAVAVPVPVTGDLTRIDRALSDITPEGATAINDALHVALQLRPLDRGRSLVLVFSDGQDNSSWIESAALADEVRRTGVVLHAVELRDVASVPPPQTDPRRIAMGVATGRPSILGPLAAASGGRVWSARSSKDLRDLFTRALEEMRARYLLTFTPSGVTPEGWHELKVALRNARGDVTARPAYFVAPRSP